MLEAIIKTLCYSHIFDFPLKDTEIHQRLIGKRAILSQIKSTLDRQTKIKSKKGYYYVANGKIVEDRVQRKEYSRQKIDRASKLTAFLRKIKTIEAVYVTGAVAVENANKQDDIDLLIITKPNRLWTTRFVVNLFLDLLGSRRKPLMPKANNKLCLNLWLTTDSLMVKKEHQNLYSAYEVIQAKALFDRGDIHNAFLYQNRWIKKILPNAKVPSKQTAKISRSKENKLERFLYALQKSYMQSKITREKIDSQSAFFHPRDTAGIVIQKYQKCIKKYV